MEHYFDKLENTMRSSWNRPALSDLGGDTFTYASLALEIEKWHGIFRLLGLKKGDKVAICARNCSRWAISFLATVTYNAVAVPVLCDHKAEAILKLSRHSESRILLTDRQIFSNFENSSLAQFEAILDINDNNPLYCNSPVKKIQIQDIECQKFCNKNGIHYDSSGNAAELALINYTSGTTSEPKGVMIRHESISHMVEFAQAHVKAAPGDTLVSMLPMAHMYGLMFELIYPLLSGVHITYLCRVPSPTMLVRTMKEIKPYMIVTVPLVMEKIYDGFIRTELEKPAVRILSKLPFAGRIVLSKFRSRLLSSLGGNIRHFIIGGAALNPHIERELRRIGLPYTVGYGMTEACPLLAYADCETFAEGSCGRKVDCVELKIDSKDPQTIPGEILAKGPTICNGYFKNDEATAEAFTEDGYFKTGDLGICDAQGNLFIKGRCKTMILSSTGQNIYPEEVESVLNNQAEVMESLVVERSGKLVALVCLDCNYVKEASLSDRQIAEIPESIRNMANVKLPKFSQLSKVEVRMEPFEKTPKMSIKRYLYC